MGGLEQTPGLLVSCFERSEPFDLCEHGRPHLFRPSLRVSRVQDAHGLGLEGAPEILHGADLGVVELRDLDPLVRRRVDKVFRGERGQCSAHRVP